MKSRKIALLILFPLCVATNGCRSGSSSTSSVSASSEPASSGSVQQTGASVRNPTVAHCLEKGFEVEPVEEGGVVRSHMCVNANAGKKCDSWAFYRNECGL